MDIVEVKPAVPPSVLPGADFADAFRATPAGQDIDLEGVAAGLGSNTPAWVRILLKLRNILVRPFGLVTEDQAGTMRDGRIVFPVLSSEPDRVVMGLDDKHLDFRIVIDRSKGPGEQMSITATTLVRTHNTGGRLYLTAIKPFHRVIVPAMLRSALGALP